MARCSLNSVLSVLLVLIVCARSGFAISCFVCNSNENYEGEKCWNLTPADAGKPDFYYKDCKLEEQVPGKNFTRCRVQVQSFGDETRIIRSCATPEIHESKTDCIDRTGTSKIKLRYCECEKDGCNSAMTVYASVITLVISTLIGSFVR